MLFPTPERPSSVTILSVLLVALGIIELVTGLLLGLAFASPAVSPIIAALVGVPSMFTFLLPVLAVLWFTFGIFSFIFAYAVWRGWKWSWVATVVFATNALTVAGFGLLIGSFANLIPIAVITLVLKCMITYPLRVYLGRIAPLPSPYVLTPAPYPVPSAARTPYAPQVTPRPSPPQPSYPAGWPSACPTCGAQTIPGASFCGACQTRLR